MCPTQDAIEFSAMLSGIILGLAQFQFFAFFCYAVHRILRRLLR